MHLQLKIHRLPNLIVRATTGTRRQELMAGGEVTVTVENYLSVYLFKAARKDRVQKPSNFSQLSNLSLQNSAFQTT